MVQGYSRLFTRTIWKGLRRTTTYDRRCRMSSETTRERAHVLFLHFGLPRSEYYAKGFLRRAAADYYQIPKNLERFIPSTFLLNAKVRDSIAEYEPSNNIEETLDYFTNRVQGRLNTVMPEFETISCSTAFLYDEPLIDEQLVRLCKNGYSHVVVVPLYPHFCCAQSGFLLNEVERSLQTFTVASAVDGREVPCERIMPNTSNSFRVSALHRWGNHPVLSEYWLDILQRYRNDIGGIIFCAPSIRGYDSKIYRHSVWSTCERVAAGLDDSFPWRLGFFNAWDQWSLPIRDSIKAQTKRLIACVPLGKQIAVVPVSSMFPDFNTFSLLPRITAHLDRTVLVPPEPDNPVLVQGVVEVIKNHLLGRRNAQLRNRCDWCVYKQCEYTRDMLSDS